jgi:hypothetical protein
MSVSSTVEVPLAPAHRASPRPTPLWRRALALVGVLALTASVLGLGGCGTAEGMGENNPKNQAQLRLLNASLGSALELWVDDSLRASGIAYGGTSAELTLSTDSHDVALRRGSSGSAVQDSQALTLTGKTHSTLVAYGRNGAPQTLLLSDDLDTPASNRTRLRVVNAAVDAGALDVYLTSSSAALSDVNPVVSALAVGSGGSSTVDVTSGTWRLRVTGSGDASDLRLDLSGVALGSGDIVTLLLTPSSGGVLVHALSYSQDSDAVAQRSNTSARVRLIAGTSPSAAHSATVGGSAIGSSSSSPWSTGAYTRVSAGSSQTLTITVNGSAIATSALDLSAGADLTLLVYGTPSAPAYAVFTDDNGLPASSSQARVRLANGLNGSGSAGIALSIDADPKADSLLAGAASAYASVGTDSSRRFTVTQSDGSVTYDESLTLAAQGIYTLFALGDATASNPRSFVLRRDR